MTFTSATYRDAEIPEYEHNPLILALPPPKNDSKVIEHICVDPLESKGVAIEAPNVRRKCTDRISRFVFPLPEYLELYRCIDSAICEGYLYRNPTTPTGQHYLHYLDSEESGVEPCTGFYEPTGVALSLFGPSGAGKTRGISRVLSQFPQKIHHTEFKGRPLEFSQVTWIRLDCPSSSTVWGFIEDLVDALAKVIGPSVFEVLKPYPKNISQATNRIERVLRSNFLGLLVLDELQKLRVGSAKLRMELLNVFLTISNRSGIPILFCGNESAKPLLAETLRNARRAESGGVVNMAEIDKRVWPEFVKVLWSSQYTHPQTALTDGLSEELYRLATGLPSFACQIFRAAQILVIGSGDETITREVLREAKLANCPLSGEHLEIRAKSLALSGNQSSSATAERTGSHPQSPGKIADINRVLHPEFEAQILGVRSNGFRIPVGVLPDTVRSCGETDDPLAELDSKGYLLTDLMAIDDHALEVLR